MKRLLASVAATVLSLTPVLAQDCTPTVTTVDPGSVERFDGLAESGEIGRQDGGGNLDWPMGCGGGQEDS